MLTKHPQKKQKTSPINTLVDYLNDLRIHSIHSDICLKTKTTKFHLHKLILMRSSYFKSIFDGKWSESEKEELDLNEIQQAIPGVDDNTFELFFEYMYTDCVKSIPENKILPFCELAKFLDLPKAVYDAVGTVDGFKKLILLNSLGENWKSYAHQNQVVYAMFETVNELQKMFIWKNNSKPMYAFDEAAKNEKDFTKEDYLRIKRKDIEKLSISFLQEFTKCELIPWKLKVLVLYFSILEKFGDPSKIRKNEQAKEYVQLIDSLPIIELNESIDVTLDNLKQLQIFEHHIHKLEKLATETKKDPSLLPTKLATTFDPPLTICKYFKQLSLKSISEWTKNLSLVNQLRIVILCGERSAAYWWHFFVQNNLGISVKIQFIFRQKSASEYFWEKKIEQTKPVVLTNDDPVELHIVYDRCVQGMRIGMDIEGFVVVELLPSVPYTKLKEKINAKRYPMDMVDWN